MLSDFVAQGPKYDHDLGGSLRDRQKRAQEIRRELTIKYAAEYAKALWLGKLVIDWKICREVSRRMDPRYRLYLERKKIS